MKDFNRFKDYLNNVLEIHPDEDELEDMIALAVQHDAYENNKGYKFERTEYNPREKAFYEQWQKENEPHPHVNNGQGILQDLFIERNPEFPIQRKWIADINNRDRWVVATVIQWLGTNCGLSFLHETLRKFNYRIIEEPADKK